MSQNFRFSLLAFILVLNLYSQENIKLGTYINNDKLTYITLMNNNTFGYILYDRESPYTYSQTKIKETKGNCNIHGFILKELGSGKYEIVNDSIELTFNEQLSVVDSLKISYFETEKYKNTVNITFIPHYNYRSLGMTEIEVRDLKNQIIANSYENNLSPNIEITRFPLKLIINSEKELELIKAQNQQIDIYINCFKTYNIDLTKKKTYSINSLIIIPEK